MQTSEIDISPLKRAVARLEEGLRLWSAEPGNALYRDGLIQRFEFTYEQSHKTLKRYLQSVAANPDEVSTWSFQDLIREGSDRGLLRSPWPVWQRFRQARTNTSHTYDEGKAVRVLDQIPEFLLEAEALIASLEHRLARL